MRVIGVLDLRGGRAVHARGGARATYAPVERVAGVALERGNAVGLARLYLGPLGVRELYVADLDAIRGGAPQRALTAALAALGAPLWVDAGVATAAAARDTLAAGATTVVVGLETLPDFGALAAICGAAGGSRVALSLDLRAGELLARHGAVANEEPAEAVAARAAAAGVGTVIVLDLARVGTGRGLDLALIRRVRAAAPAVTLLAGGGARDASDLRQLAAAGCDGALVATALHTGGLGAGDVRAAAAYGAARPGSASEGDHR